MRKLISLAVTGALLPAMAFAAGLRVTVDGRETTFVDVDAEAWFAPYVRDAAQSRIVSGYKDAQGNLTGSFGPGDPVTVAQALKIAIEGAGYDMSGYVDVAAKVGDHWAAPYVSVAKAEGFILFKGEASLDRQATRAEVARIFTDAFVVNTEGGSGNRYSDVPASSTHAGAIEALSRDNVVTGDTDVSGKLTGTFRPNESINRAEAVKIVMKARQVYNPGPRGRKETSDPEAETNVIIYTDNGFEPAEMTVPVNTVVKFRNESSHDMWVASDPHPVHSDHGDFDARDTFKSGQEYSYKFTEPGTYTYHNHVKSTHRGMIIAQ